jgi:hypothetical protein
MIKVKTILFLSCLSVAIVLFLCCCDSPQKIISDNIITTAEIYITVIYFPDKIETITNEILFAHIDRPTVSVGNRVFYNIPIYTYCITVVTTNKQ